MYTMYACICRRCLIARVLSALMARFVSAFAGHLQMHGLSLRDAAGSQPNVVVSPPQRWVVPQARDAGTYDACAWWLSRSQTLLR